MFKQEGLAEVVVALWYSTCGSQNLEISGLNAG